MSAAEVVAAADESLAGYEHRAVAIKDEAEGARLAPEITAIPGWEAETNLYMVWRETGIARGDDVRECALSECEDLRRELIRGEFPPEMPDLDATADQLLEMNRRFSDAAGDRWFVAPRAATGGRLLPPQRGRDRAGRGRRHPRLRPAATATRRR